MHFEVRCRELLSSEKEIVRSQQVIAFKAKSFGIHFGKFAQRRINFAREQYGSERRGMVVRAPRHGCKSTGTHGEEYASRIKMLLMRMGRLGIGK